jgi:hypothetical protein
MQLPVDIGDTDAVGIYNCEVDYPTSDQTLRAPASYTSNPENDDPLGHGPFHPFFTQQQFGSLKYALVYIHRIQIYCRTIW